MVGGLAWAARHGRQGGTGHGVCSRARRGSAGWSRFGMGGSVGHGAAGDAGQVDARLCEVRSVWAGESGGGHGVGGPASFGRPAKARRCWVWMSRSGRQGEAWSGRGAARRGAARCGRHGKSRFGRAGFRLAGRACSVMKWHRWGRLGSAVSGEEVKACIVEGGLAGRAGRSRRWRGWARQGRRRWAVVGLGAVRRGPAWFGRQGRLGRGSESTAGLGRQGIACCCRGRSGLADRVRHGLASRARSGGGGRQGLTQLTSVKGLQQCHSNMNVSVGTAAG